MPPLTARRVSGAKATSKAYAIPDGTVPGLELRVSRHGAKTFSLRYRIGAYQRRLTLGSASFLTLADARDMAREALRNLKKRGIDPAEVQRVARNALSFAGLAELYLDRRALGRTAGARDATGGLVEDVWALASAEGSPTIRGWKEERRYLANEALPAWRHRPADSITRRDVRSLVEGVADRGAPVSANRLLGLLRRVFAWAVEQELLPANPAAGMKPPGGREKARDRVLNDDEIRQFWQATEGMDLTSRAFWRLRLITAQRSGEIATMSWRDIDQARRWWTIPAERAKNDLAHRVSLTGMALDLLQQLREQGIVSATLVLPEVRNRRRLRASARAFEGIPDFRGHDLRRTAASGMASAGVPRHHIGRVLNHAETGVTATYDRHIYDPEKRRALEAWEAELRKILDGRPFRQAGGQGRRGG